MAKKKLSPEELNQVGKLELKRAHVPLRICLKLALKNMWKKKFRYLVMLIICALSLTFLAFTIELNGEILRQNVYTMIENGYRFTDIYKYVPSSKEAIEENPYNKYSYEQLDSEAATSIKDKVDDIVIHEYANVSINYAKSEGENANYFYTGIINTLIKYDSSNTYELLAGRLPKEGTKEILITDYLVNALMYFKLYPNCNNIYDYINQHLSLNIGSDYVIVGIIETNFEQWSHFSNVEAVEVSDKENYSFQYDFTFMNSVILNSEYFNLEKTGTSKTLSFNNRSNGSSNSIGTWSFKVDTPLYEGATGVYASNSPMGLTTQNVELCRNGYNYYTGKANYFGRYPENENEIVIPTTWIYQLYGYNWTMNVADKYYTWEDRNEHRQVWDKINGTEIELTVKSRGAIQTEYTKKYKVVGLTTSTQTVSNTPNCRVCQIYSQEFQNIYYKFSTQEEKILVELPHDPQAAYNLFNRAFDAGYVINVWAYRNDIDSYVVDPFIDVASKAGLFVFAAFTMAVMWTIISIEIVDSKKEIGILRSIGLSGGKVAFIFIFQTASVIILSYFVGVYAAYRLIPIYNSGITDEFNKIILYMYTFTYRTPLYLGIFVIGMTMISTLIPLFKILSHKIIDVINERDV